MTREQLPNVEQAVSKTFRLSKRLAVEMTLGPAGWTCEWVPEVPAHLSRKEQRAYLRARREMFERLSEIVGGTVAVLDLEPDGRLHASDVIEKSR